ncbi:MAG: transposase [Deltaproteobacteria bacterium]|nr:transposase [Deltaproteobacteria bacterium]MBW2673262.1 transposase [Deltaproteobacteria bacterium]
MKLEKTSFRNHFPAKCLECAKSFKPFIHGMCSLCRDLGFQEEILCDLNRSTQDPSSFDCHAFQPLLRRVVSAEQETRPEREVRSSEIILGKLLDSDKVKYQRVLALQKLARDPDDVMLEIRYHFAWNVIGRKPVFAEPATKIDLISNTITTCSEAVGGFACLLWLAPDHIHLYVEGDGEMSPDSMAQKLKRLSEKPMLEQFPSLIAYPGAKGRLWDEAYFVETIG